MTRLDQMREKTRVLKQNILDHLKERAATVADLTSTFNAKRSTVYALLCGMRGEMLVHDEVSIVPRKSGIKVAAWHLGPAPLAACTEADEADTDPARRIIRQSWPRDFPPPDPLIAHFYGRHA